LDPNVATQKVEWRCKCCGLKRKGGANRWAMHIMGRVLGSNQEMGITACTGGKTEESKNLWRDAKKVVGEHQKKVEERVECSNERKRRQREVDRMEEAGNREAGGAANQGGASQGSAIEGTSGNTLFAPRVQSSLGFHKKQKTAAAEEADQAIAKFFYANGVSFNASKSSEYDAMVQKIKALDDKINYVPPNDWALRHKLLDDQVCWRATAVFLPT
jgi:hypothetical protein